MRYGKRVDRIQPPAKVDPERTDQGGFVPRRFHAGFMPCHTFSWPFFGQARFVVGVVSDVPIDIWSKNKLEGICLITVLEKNKLQRASLAQLVDAREAAGILESTSRFIRRFVCT